VGREPRGKAARHEHHHPRFVRHHRGGKDRPESEVTATELTMNSRSVQIVLYLLHYLFFHSNCGAGTCAGYVNMRGACS
jgi:hypothetical protein